MRAERDQPEGQPPTTRGWTAQCVRADEATPLEHRPAARAAHHILANYGILVALILPELHHPSAAFQPADQPRAHRHHRRLLLPLALPIELLYERSAYWLVSDFGDHLRLATYLLSGLFLNDQTAFERMRAVSGVTGDYAALVSANRSWLRHRHPSLNDIAATRRRLPGHHYDLPGDDTVRHLCGADSTFSTCGSTDYGRHF